MFFCFQLFDTERLLEHNRKNRNSLLNALYTLAPKPSKRCNLSSMEVMRAVMRQLAPDSIWQFWSCQGKSGTGKPSFKMQMTKLYRVVCVVFTKVTSVDFATADSTLTEFLKHCTYRKASTAYRHQYSGRFKSVSDADTSKKSAGVTPAGDKRQREPTLTDISNLCSPSDLDELEEVEPEVEEDDSDALE